MANFAPAKHGARNVPVYLQEEFQKEVQTIVGTDVLESVTELIEWVTSNVLVEKKLVEKELCLDPKDLNGLLESKPYYSGVVD